MVVGVRAVVCWGGDGDVGGRAGPVHQQHYYYAVILDTRSSQCLFSAVVTSTVHRQTSGSDLTDFTTQHPLTTGFKSFP